MTYPGAGFDGQFFCKGKISDRDFLVPFSPEPSAPEHKLLPLEGVFSAGKK